MLPDLKTCQKCIKSYLRWACVHEHKTKCGIWRPCGKVFHTTRAFKKHFEFQESRFSQSVVDKFNEKFDH